MSRKFPGSLAVKDSVLSLQWHSCSLAREILRAIGTAKTIMCLNCPIFICEINAFKLAYNYVFIIFCFRSTIEEIKHVTENVVSYVI